MSSEERNGGSAGVVSRRAGPVVGIINAFLLRKTGDNNPAGATSAVVSAQSSSLFRGMALMTWSNWPGEGMSASSFREELINTGYARRPVAANIEARSVCLSLQSPY